jgi:DNA-binding LacI/PurR family transcriptional regulator
MARPTIADIATRAGVSKGAVSFALNGRPGVSDATRERILKIAEQMSWRPHSAARALGASRVDSVGLFAHLLSGVQSGLSAESISLQLLIVEDTAAEIEVYRRWTSEHRVDGVILVDLTVKDPRVEALKALELPAVVIGGRGGKGALASVWADDRDAMLSIVEYLAALGHRRIAHVAGTPNFQHTQRRIRAVRDAAPRLGLLDAPSLTTDFSDAEGAAITRKLLSQPDRPTAIVYDSDVMAVAGLGVAMEMGVSVPGDLSIVAFDDSILTQLMHPALTALSRDTFDFGRQAAEVLLQTIADPGTVINRRSSDPVLTVRESTAPPA